MTFNRNFYVSLNNKALDFNKTLQIKTNLNLSLLSSTQFLYQY